MYLHLGHNTVVPHKSIIGVFDLEITSHSRQTRAFLSEAQKKGQVKAVIDELPASFVLCAMDGKTTVYLSPISAATLGKRARENILED